MAVIFDKKNRVIRITNPVTFAELMVNCMMFCDDYGDYTIEVTLLTTWGEQIAMMQELKWMKKFNRLDQNEINPSAN